MISKIVSNVPKLLKMPTTALTPKSNNQIRTAVKAKTGAILSEPHVTPMGLVKIFVTVITGLLIGAAISKNIANFLEENDLFVPSDDDDDDD